MTQYRMPSGAIVEASDEVAERLGLKPIGRPRPKRRSRKAKTADDASDADQQV